jgi:D-alanine-D-alanine ligase
MPKQISIVVACGGYSSEREVSLRSGQRLYESLCRLGYAASMVDPTRDLAPLLSTDLVFNVVHGAYGEDGTLQAFLEHHKIPFIGSNSASSVICMNKVITKQILQLNQLPTPPFTVLYSAITELPPTFQFPVFLKPINGGSSIDTFYVDNQPDLIHYAKTLFNRYHHYVLESFISGKEITIGIIEIPDPIALPVLELRPKGKFYDYHSKYTPGMTQFIIPPAISDSDSQICKDLARRAHQCIGCRGLSRTDMILSETSGPYILEINSLPGFTDLSDLPAQAEAYGLSYDELVKHLVESQLTKTCASNDSL